MYEQHSNGMIRRIDTGAWIPADDKNRDYRRFLAWRDKGNSPTVVPPTPRAKTGDEVLVEDLRAASTIGEIKAALIKRFGG